MFRTFATAVVGVNAEKSIVRQREVIALLLASLIAMWSCAVIGLPAKAAKKATPEVPQSSSSAAADRQAQRLVESANAAFKAGKYALAVAGYSDLLKLKPADPRIFYNRGLAHFRLNENEDAYADFSEALNIDPGFSLALVNRAKVALARHDYGQALLDIDRALTLRPADAAILYYRGMANQSLGDSAKALADLTAAIDLNPKFAPALAERGHAFLALGRNAEAMLDFEKARELDRNNARAIRGLEQLGDQASNKPSPPTAEN